MAGVGQQGHRIGAEAEDHLDRDEADVERDPDRERAREIVVRLSVLMV